MKITLNNITSSTRALIIDFSEAQSETENYQVVLPDEIPCQLAVFRTINVTFSGEADVSGWDVRHLESLRDLFKAATSIPDGIQQWDVSNATNAVSAFEQTEGPYPDITGWDVGSVGNMNAMFESSNFNQDISGWDIGASDVTDMFNYSNFDQDLSGVVLPNVFFLDRIDRFGIVSDSFAPNSPLELGGSGDGKRPQTAIEAGISENPLTLVSRHYDWENSSSVYAEYQGTRALYASVAPVGDPSNFRFKGILRYNFDNQAVTDDDDYEVKVYGRPTQPVTFDNVKEITSWGGFSAYSNQLRFKAHHFLDAPTLKIPTSAPQWPGLRQLFYGVEGFTNPEALESWDVSHVNNLDFFLGVDQDQDLSGWSVPLITSEPRGWLLPPDRSPQWGT